jgi:hypothetical protein
VFLVELEFSSVVSLCDPVTGKKCKQSLKNWNFFSLGRTVGMVAAAWHVFPPPSFQLFYCSRPVWPINFIIRIFHAGWDRLD